MPRPARDESPWPWRDIWTVPDVYTRMYQSRGLDRGDARRVPRPLDLSHLHSLYEAHAPEALTLALLLTRDRALAEDIVQEAFVRVCRRLVDLRDPGAFPAYLRRTVVNLTRSHFRRGRLERRSLQKLSAAPHEDSGSEMSGHMPSGALWEGLSQLPYRQRAALVLRFCEDLSEREVADTLGTTEKAVRSLVGRGLNALRGQLGGADRWIL